MHRGIHFLFTGLMVVLNVGCNTQTEDVSNVISESDKETLTYLKKVEWPKDYAQQDTLLLDRILGEDFQMIDQAGNWYDKLDELDWIKNNAFDNDSFYYEIKRLDALPNGTAVILLIYLVNVNSYPMIKKWQMEISGENAWLRWETSQVTS